MSKPLILLPRIKIHNANALSSPVTIGFPAMTAWLGFVHALQRKINAKTIPVIFSAVGVVAHHFDLQTHKGARDFNHSIIGTANPLEPKSAKDKPKGNAVRPSFIEEARVHLEVSLLIEFGGIEAHEVNALLDQIYTLSIGHMKIAGGDIHSCKKPILFNFSKATSGKLMPGYALIERRDLMVKAMEAGQDAMDAMLGYLVTHHTCSRQKIDENEKIVWEKERKSIGKGWIVPIATGFQGISLPGKAQNQRDPDMQHRFAESVVTLGEFKMIYRLESPNELLWRYEVDLENDLYRCIQQNTTIEEDCGY